jgi:hypothetical protein
MMIGVLTPECLVRMVKNIVNFKSNSLVDRYEAGTEVIRDFRQSFQEGACQINLPICSATVINFYFDVCIPVLHGYNVHFQFNFVTRFH